MPRFAAEGLDLSRLPLPQAVRTLDYEALLAARRVRLKAAFDAAGIPYDAARLDSDPAMQLQQVDAYRELLTLARINAAVRSTMVAFATGGDLDQLAARYAIRRMDGEGDDRLRWRVMLAPEAWGLGKIAGYLQAALTAHVDVLDAGVWVDRDDPAQPVVRIAPMVAAGDGLPSVDVLDAVRIFLNRDDVKGATDVVAVQPPTLRPYEISLVVQHLAGPDPSVLRSASSARLAALAADRHRPGRAVQIPAIIAAGLPPAAESAYVLQPSVDIRAAAGELSYCTKITVASEVIGG